MRATGRRTVSIHDDKLASIAEGLGSSLSRQDLAGNLQKATSYLGCQNFTAAIYRSSLTGDPETRLHNYDEALTDDPYWRDPAVRQADPVIGHCSRSTAPIFWDFATFRQSGRLKHYDRLASFGLRQGTMVVLHRAENHRFSLSFEWASASPLSPDRRQAAMAAVQVFAQFAEHSVAHLCRYPETSNVAADELDGLEHEALYWLARGLPLSVIASAMRCQADDLKSALASCVRKLRAASLPQAAAKAVALGYVQSLPPANRDFSM